MGGGAAEEVDGVEVDITEEVVGDAEVVGEGVVDVEVGLGESLVVEETVEELGAGD